MQLFEGRLLRRTLFIFQSGSFIFRQYQVVVKDFNFKNDFFWNGFEF